MIVRSSPKLFLEIGISIPGIVRSEKEYLIPIAAHLYREGEISIGKALELADIPFENFIEQLKKRKMRNSLFGVFEVKEEESAAERYLK